MDGWEEMKLALLEAAKKTHDPAPFPLSARLLSHLLQLIENPAPLFDAITSELLSLDHNLIRPLVPRIIAVVSPVLLAVDDDDNRLHSLKAHEIIFNLSKAAGSDAVLDAVKPLIRDANEHVRRKASAVIGAASPAIGVPAILPLLKGACGSEECWQARHTGVMAVGRVAAVLGKRASPHVEPLLQMVHPNLSHDERILKRAAASSVAAFAESVIDRRGQDVFEGTFRPLMKSIRKGIDSPEHDAFMVPMWAAIQLMDDPMCVSCYCSVSLVSDERHERRRADIAIRIFDRYLDVQDVTQLVQRLVAKFFFKSFWAISAKEELKADDYQPLANATAKVAMRLGIEATLALVEKQLTGAGQTEPHITMVKEAVVKLHTAYTLYSAQHWDEGLRIMHCLFS